VGFEALLIHTVQVYRRSGEVDRLGQPLSVNPRQHEIDGETLVHTYPCRVDRGKGGLVMNERMIDTFEQTWCMYTLPDVDIITNDACRVLDGDGNEIVPLSKVKIKSAAADSSRTHHLEFDLWAQSGPS
jgi:hypothetical protein